MARLGVNFDFLTICLMLNHYKKTLIKTYVLFPQVHPAAMVPLVLPSGSKAGGDGWLQPVSCVCTEVLRVIWGKTPQ